ncbi:MAG: Fe-Mn family superoxide dismutase [Candidatus Peregrinibacteria bacterium]
MEHQVKDFSHLIGKLDDLSAKQVEAHLGLYKGYVNKLNEIETKLRDADRGLANYSFGEYSELKRREAVAFNGAYFHQWYFENLTPKGAKRTPELDKAITKSFGSIDNYLKDLKASAASTPGWVLTTKNKIDGKLHNYIVFEHHIGLPVHQEIILALDCWEHAYMIDYGTKKTDYLETFLKNVDWNVVSQRLK